MNLKQLFLAAAIILSMANGFSQTSGTCGNNLNWKVNLTYDTLTISGSGAMEDYSLLFIQPWTLYNSHIKAILIGDSVTSIGNYAFRNCLDLISVTISDSVKTIGQNAFMDCRSLTSINIPGGVISIGNNAFYNCSTLTAINVDNNNAIYSSAGGVLYNKQQDTLIMCPVGKTGIVTIPNGVKIIHSSAFYNCSGLTNVVMPKSITTIGRDAFYNCSSLNTITISDSVITIERDAFSDCSTLHTVNYNAINCTSIGYFFLSYSYFPVFYNCTALKTLNIGNQVKSIPNYAFMYLDSLTTITIPDSVTNIGEGAFYECTGLTSITSNAVNPPVLGNNVFYNVNTAIPVYVPCLSTYKSEAEWSSFTNYIPTTTADTIQVSDSVFSGTVYNGYGFNISTGAGIYYRYQNCDTVICLTLTTISNDNSPFFDGEFENCWEYKDPQNGKANYWDLKNGSLIATLNGMYTLETYMGNVPLTAFRETTDVYNGNYSLKLVSGNMYIGGQFFFLPGVAATFYVDIQSANCILGKPFTDRPSTLKGYFKYAPVNGDSAAIEIMLKKGGLAIGSGKQIIYAPVSNWTIFDVPVNYTSNEIPDSIVVVFSSSANYNLTSMNTLLTSTGQIGSTLYIDDVEFEYSEYDIVYNYSDTICENSSYTDDNFTNLTQAGFYCDTLQSADGGDSIVCLTLYYYSIGGAAGALDWSFNPCDSTLTISGNGVMEDYSMVFTPWYSYNSVIKNVIIENSVSNVGSSAFSGISSLVSVTIPNGIKSIGANAFADCYNLNSIVIPNSVTHIGEEAFGLCYSLNSIYVESNNLNYSSENGVLFDKTKTTLIQYPNGKTDTYYIIPNSVITIGKNAFAWCYNLTSVTIPDSVTTIGQAAFRDCHSLQTVNYNAINCTSMGSSYSIYSSVFGNCPVFETLNIGNNVKNIPNSAFAYCSGLNTVTIPNNVTTIGSYAFYFCSNLGFIDVESNNMNYTSEDGVLFNKTKTILKQYPVGKTNTTYTIPDGVITIDSGSFETCHNLISVTIPNSVTSIKRGAFAECINLTTVIIGKKVDTIEEYAFFYCNSLTSITNLNPVPIGINVSVFYRTNISTCRLKVPNRAVSDYKNTNVWKEFRIEGFDEPTLTVSGKIIRQDQMQSTGMVVLIDKTQIKYSTTRLVIVGNGGTYSFTDVPSGTYIIKYAPGTDENVLPTYYGNTEQWEDATIVTVIDISLQNKDITLIPASVMQGNSIISGYVGGDGRKSTKSISQKSVENPVDSVDVYLQKEANTSWNTIAQTLTNAEGYFEFRDVPAGRYRVILDVPGLPHSDNPEIIEVNDGDTIQNIEYEITENGIKNNTEDEVGIVGANNYSPMRVYPNPTTGQLTIECRDAINRVSTGEYTIYNIMGQVVMQGTLSCRDVARNVSTTVDVESLAKGMYYLKIEGKTVKVIKN